MKTRCLLVCFLSLASLGLATHHACALTYCVRPLTGLTGVIDINDSGQILGRDSIGQMVIWKDGSVTDVITGLPDGLGFTVEKLSNSGAVVGYSSYPELVPGTQMQVTKPFIWTRQGVTELPGLPGAITRLARDVNDAGYVLGSSITEDAYGTLLSSGWLWHDGITTEISALPEDDRAVGTAMNNSGDMVGRSLASGSARNAVWQDGVCSLAPFQFPDVPYDINDSGLMASRSANATIVSLWQSGELVRSYTFAEFGINSPVQNTALNNSGLCIGSSAGYTGADPTISMVGWVLSEDGITFLPSIGLYDGQVSDSPRAINNVGQIVGSSARDQWVMWEPVPEPSSLLVLGGGLLGLVGVIRRKK